MSEPSPRKEKAHARHSWTACIAAQGWQRCDHPADEVGECVAETGCSRPGRWTHPYRQGNYCAQHVHESNCTQISNPPDRSVS